MTSNSVNNIMTSLQRKTFQSKKIRNVVHILNLIFKDTIVFPFSVLLEFQVK